MSTSYTTIYTSFLSKITDFDLPPLTDDELKAYCKSYMESAIVKLPEIVSDLSKREILDDEIVTEVEPTEEPPVQESENPGEEPVVEPQEPVEPVTYILHLNESVYGNYTYKAPDITHLIANNSSFKMFIRVRNFIKVMSFTRGVSENKECKIYDLFSCNISYDGENQFVFSKTNSTAINYLLLYVTYDTPNTDPDPEETPQPIEVPDDMQQIIDEDGVIEAEEVFSDDLTDLEIEIIASQMVVEWLNNEINNTQLTRMFVGTKDESMASQANHIEKLTTLKEKRRADVSMLIRDYAYREWVKEV